MISNYRYCYKLGTYYSHSKQQVLVKVTTGELK